MRKSHVFLLHLSAGGHVHCLPRSSYYKLGKKKKRSLSLAAFLLPTPGPWILVLNHQAPQPGVQPPKVAVAGSFHSSAPWGHRSRTGTMSPKVQSSLGSRRSKCCCGVGVKAHTVFPAPARLRQDDLKFEANRGYLVSSRPGWTSQ